MEEVIILLTSSHMIAVFEIFVEPQGGATTILFIPYDFFSSCSFYKIDTLLIICILPEVATLLNTLIVHLVTTSFSVKRLCILF